MNKMVGIVIGVIVLIGVVALIATGGDDMSSNSTGNDTSTQVPEQSETTPSNADEMADQTASADKSVDIVMKNFEFSQDKIMAKPGDTVTINLSVDSGSHDFVIDELDVQSETIGSSDTDTVTFTIPEDAGGTTYAFYCSVGNHRQQGMEGELVIEG